MEAIQFYVLTMFVLHVMTTVTGAYKRDAITTFLAFIFAVWAGTLLYVEFVTRSSAATLTTHSGWVA